MNLESTIALQNIDCNCNDCISMVRDIAKYKSFDYLYTENGRVTNPSYRIQYGNCAKLNKPVSFIPNILQLDTQNCFKHRRLC
jgi:hypothetical protein